MTIFNLISQTTPPLRTDDTVEHALGLMMELRVHHMPVVDAAGLLVGMISEDQLLDATGPDAVLETLLGPAPVSVEPDMHVFDATRVMVEHRLTALPVADERHHYMGVVRRHDIFDQFARMFSTQSTGAIIALEVDERDYSLSRLVYTIEQNGVKILSIASESPDATDDKMRVTLKLNVTDTARVRHMLEHYGYHVVASYSEEDDGDLQYRIQEFMRYLEV